VLDVLAISEVLLQCISYAFNAYSLDIDKLSSINLTYTSKVNSND
jgi:hypothetical protein